MPGVVRDDDEDAVATATVIASVVAHRAGAVLASGAMYAASVVCIMYIASLKQAVRQIRMEEEMREVLAIRPGPWWHLHRYDGYEQTPSGEDVQCERRL